MTDELQRLTWPIINVLATLDDVAAIICFGSYALGTYDQHSDIDLFVLCRSAIIPAATRQRIFEHIPGVSEIQLQVTSPGWDNQWNPQSDRLKLGGRQFDLTYNTAGWLSTVVHKVIAEGATSIPELTFRPYAMLGLLANSVSLYDPHGFVRDLTGRLYPYPAKLKANIIGEFLPLMTDGLAELADYTRRDIGNTAFLFHLVRLCDALHSVLFALNEYYDPATKKPERELDKLARLPRNFTFRYEALLTGPFDRAGRERVVNELEHLIREVKQLLPC